MSFIPPRNPYLEESASPGRYTKMGVSTSQLRWTTVIITAVVFGIAAGLVYFLTVNIKDKYGKIDRKKVLMGIVAILGFAFTGGIVSLAMEYSQSVLS